MPDIYYAYILRSLKDDNFYTGYTSNLKRRLARHNGGWVRSTKARRPFELIYWEQFKTRSDAMKRERKLKSLKRAEKLKLIEKFKQAK